MMRSLFLLLLLIGTAATALPAQCKFSADEVDEFDSTRLVSSLPVSVGLLIPSRFETAKGPKIIDQAKMLFSHTESDQDSINSFFLTIAVPEYDYQPIEQGKNVLLAFADSTVIALYNFPDQGTFDTGTNMRLYQHTCIVPVDVYYRLSYTPVEKIRIRYTNQKKTIALSKKQQKELKEAVRCVGQAVGFLPAKP
ncbi:MAG: hypothetical protein KDC66_05610 [Phaeodactylibacter sp.]|nr:hypothetical protein [Phaeodactylibacter sp.]MCB9275711.1 hypothetical protein [Lewinellaceae bacterium]